jgi:DNA polymerase III delta prime subunit
MSELLSKALFWEKYRPNKIEDMILPERIRNIVKDGVNGNYLFHGASGMGKTTLARILMNDYPDGQHIVLNGKMGVDDLRKKVTSFCTEMIAFADPNKLRVVYFEEFDNATWQLQLELKSFMEDHSHRVRFIATCNTITKINPAIRSRFTEIDYTPTQEESKYLKNEYAKRLAHISKEEGLGLSKDNIIEIVQNRFPDFRKIWQDVQIFTVSGEVISSATVTDEDEKLFEVILSGKGSTYIWEYLYVNWMDKVDIAFNKLGRDFFEYVKERHPEKKSQLGNTVVTVVKYTDTMLPNAIDPFVTLVALVYDLQKFYLD